MRAFWGSSKSSPMDQPIYPLLMGRQPEKSFQSDHRQVPMKMTGTLRQLYLCSFPANDAYEARFSLGGRAVFRLFCSKRGCNTLPPDGRVGSGNDRGGFFTQPTVEAPGQPYRPSPALVGRLSRRALVSTQVRINHATRNNSPFSPVGRRWPKAG